jgi:prepilin-type N-terminal cleavage/methylation domain-containing protein
MKNKAKAGFTLTEILVVIAVIGLLSSIIFAITRGADEQGRIAKGLYFGQHLHNSLGSYAAGIWNLDEGSGTTTNDTSGWGNNGTLVNSPTWRCATTDPTYTPSGEGCSLEFDGSDNYVNCGNSSVLNPTVKVTFEGWIKLDSYAGTEYSPMIFRTLAYTIGIRPTGKVTYWLGSYRDSERTVQLNLWTHLVLAYDGINTNLYIDGILDKTFSGDSPSATENNTLIGRGDTSNRIFDGLIDEVRIYATSLTSAQIRSQYYAGLNRLLTEGQITQGEYKERVKNV